MTTSTVTATPYAGFEAMPLAGEWRAGSSGQSVADTDPWSGDTLLEIELANRADVDDACEAALEAQRAWAAALPVERATVMRGGGRDRRRPRGRDRGLADPGGRRHLRQVGAGAACRVERAAGSRVASAPRRGADPAVGHCRQGEPCLSLTGRVVVVVSPWNFPCTSRTGWSHPPWQWGTWAW